MPKTYSKVTRVAVNLKKELSAILSEKFPMVDYGVFSVADIELQKDFSTAKVFISTLKEQEAVYTIERLNRAASHIRSLVARKMNMRSTPAFNFVYDDTLKNSHRIVSLITDLNKDIPDDELEQ